MKIIVPENSENYLTQKEEVSILSRVVTKSVYAPDDYIGEWREIIPQEAEDILKRKQEALQTESEDQAESSEES